MKWVKKMPVASQWSSLRCLWNRSEEFKRKYEDETVGLWVVDFHFPQDSTSICTQPLENLSSKSSAGGIVAKQLVAP